jgi:prophage tail gpP-like protein
MSNVYLEIDGTRFTGWKRLSVTKSLEKMCGTFSFTASAIAGKPFPIKMRTQCKILIEDVPVINGWIEKIDVQLESDEHEITVSGRDRTNDLVDSQPDPTIEFRPPVTLKQMVEKMLEKLNLTDIQVIDNFELKPLKDIETDSIGTTAFDFLEKYAKKRQVLLTTDGYGNIVFQRSTGSLMQTVLSTERDTRGEILTSSVTYDDSKRFNLYNASASGNAGSAAIFGKEFAPAEIANQSGQAIDKEIRNSRIYYFQPDDNQENPEAENRAAWEANFRKANAMIYKCDVQGFIPTKDSDKIWQPNYLIHVIDEFADINTPLLITEVTYSQSIDEGSKTSLTCKWEKSFTLQIERPDKDKKDKNIGSKTFGV